MKDIKKKSDTELKKALYEKRKDLRVFRFSIAGSKTKNTKEGSSARKEIARILTELNGRTRV